MKEIGQGIERGTMRSLIITVISFVIAFLFAKNT